MHCLSQFASADSACSYIQNINMRHLLTITLLFVLGFSAFAQSTATSSNTPGKSSATVLFDAFGKTSALTKGWGYSTLIEHNGKRILFDGGSNADVFKHNIAAKKIDATKIDIVIISHAHHDHVNGIDYLLKVNPRVKIYFPFDQFWGATSQFDAKGSEPSVKDSLPQELRYFDGKGDVFPVPQSGGRFWNANIEHLKQSKEILPGVRLVVTSAHFMGYFSRYPQNSQAKQTNDDCSGIKFTGLTELSLAVATDKGEALFVGCSHSGVDTIARQAIAESGKTIDLLMGGFHLIPFDRGQTEKITAYLKNELKVQKVAPGHCTGHLAFKVMRDAYRDRFIYAGLGETVRF